MHRDLNARVRGFRPVGICEVDINGPLPRLSAVAGIVGRDYVAAQVLVRLATEPLGVLLIPLGPQEVLPEQLAETIWAQLRPVILDRVREAGPAAAPDSLSPDGLRLGASPPYVRRRDEVLAAPPRISVVLCTRDPQDEILDCLAALERQDYPDYEIVVVDNAPTTDALAAVVAARPGKVPIRRVVEPRPGLSWARNCGLHTATGRIVAYIDDDEVPDRYWLAEIARGFRTRDEVAAVSGMILPAALESQAQDWYEQFGGHSKGRGFTQAVFDVDSHAAQSPLYPLPPFGAGGNVAFDRALLVERGGFDVALGAGTPAHSGEETAMLCDLMLAGHTVVYRPSAFVRHHHYAEVADMARQLYGYGVGLTAFYTRAVLRDPRRCFTLARLTPTAARDLFGRDSVRTATIRADYPAELLRAQRRGMLRGPAAYLRSRREQRRVRRAYGNVLAPAGR